MKSSINRELKYFVNNIPKVRDVLKELGATFVGEKKQVDYFYQTAQPGYLLKLREEDGKQKIAYYYSSQKSDQREVKFQVWRVEDQTIKEVMDKVLPSIGVVKKVREVWKKGHLTFHLDQVEKVGSVFEVEAENGSIEEIEKLKNSFLPYLGEQIIGSNIDLVNK